MTNELFKFLLARILTKIFHPRPRLIRLIYNNLSNNIRGIDLTIPYLMGTKILVNTKDIIGWNISFFGQYERKTNKLLKELIKKEDVIIEAGANIGSETLLIAKLANNGRVIAVDPSPWSNRYLRFNLEMNKLHHVNFIPSALGDKVSSLDIHLLPDDFPNQGMTSIVKHSASDRKITVPQSTIDVEMNRLELQRLDLIKMDVQGSELAILKGGELAISQFRPVILLEASPGHSSLNEIYQFLHQKEYRIYKVGRKLNELTAASLQSGDWICLHKEGQIDVNAIA